MKAGIHHGVPMATYVALPFVSSGLLHNCLQYSPYHARYWQEHPEPASKETDAGSAAHAVLLEGNESPIVVCDFADWRKDAAKEMRETARAEGKYPVLAAKMDSIRAMVAAAESVISGSELSKFWDAAQREVTCIWNEGTLPCRARFDVLAAEHPTVVDYKTCGGSVNPESWVRTVIGQGYDVQGAHYVRSLGSGGRFLWLAQENEPPYAACVMDMSPALQEFAESRRKRAMAMWAAAVSTGRFPSYPKETCSLEPPAYALAQEEEQRLGNPYDLDVMFGSKA